MIKPTDLIEKFKYALDNHYGYIWGAAGIQWTQAKQNQKVQYMVTKYGANWQKNADAKNDNYYSAAMYGSKWIGHTVADCSGLFVWAFKHLGGSIYHGSNSIYDRYCSAKGKTTDEIRKNMKPGTAVFTGDASKHGHIGLYVGNGKVIEASGTIAGVCTSNLTAGKWTYWGELKDVSYSSENAPVSPSEPKDEDFLIFDYPTLKKGSKGEYVTLLQRKLMEHGYSLPRYGADGDFGNETLSAVKAFQKDHGLTDDGIVGKNTWAALDADKTDTYVVIIRGLSKSKAESIVKTYGGEMNKE